MAKRNAIGRQFLQAVENDDCLCGPELCPSFPARAFMRLIEAYARARLREPDRQIKAQVWYQIAGASPKKLWLMKPAQLARYINKGADAYDKALHRLLREVDDVRNCAKRDDGFRKLMSNAAVLMEHSF
jgi:hypothetical protein